MIKYFIHILIFGSTLLAAANVPSPRINLANNFRQNLHNMQAKREQAILNGLGSVFDGTIAQAQEIIERIEINLNTYDSLAQNTNNLKDIQMANEVSKNTFADIATLQNLLYDLEKLLNAVPGKKPMDIRPLAIADDGNLSRLNVSSSKRNRTRTRLKMPKNHLETSPDIIQPAQMRSNESSSSRQEENFIH